MFGFSWRPTARQTGQPFIPDWLVQSVQSKLTHPNMVKRDDIKVVVVKMRDRRFPMVAASVNVDNKEGVFILYDLVGDGFQEIYAKEVPVIAVQVYSDLAFVITARIGSGTGILRDEHFIIRQTPKGFAEVWSGVATYMKMLPEVPPLFYQTGSVYLDHDGQRMIYSTMRETYHRGNLDSPRQRQCFYQIYRYSDDNHSYVLQSTG